MDRLIATICSIGSGALIALGLSTMGCAREPDTKLETPTDSRFDRIYYIENGINVIRDVRTGCLYLISGTYGGITPVINPDGTPSCDQEGSR